ncbi:hypothetical protein UVI_02027960 [Ustilaginoidea virens]|nr:hypothetical protein UVI_02027960 [Ustilaginoidea virens]
MVIVAIVAVIGACTATLFFIAKKREWTAKEVLRHSVRKVVTAMTPRRAEFPASVTKSTGSSRRDRRREQYDNVSFTPQIRVGDLEKGIARDKVKDKSRK